MPLSNLKMNILQRRRSQEHLVLTLLFRKFQFWYSIFPVNVEWLSINENDRKCFFIFMWLHCIQMALTTSPKRARITQNNKNLRRFIVEEELSYFDIVLGQTQCKETR